MAFNVAILLHDTPGEKIDKSVLGKIKSVVGLSKQGAIAQEHILRGELIVSIPGDDITLRDDGQKPHNFRLIRDPTTTLFCEDTEVAPLDDYDFHLLEGITSNNSRYDVFITQGKLDWGSQLRKGSKVYVSLASHTLYPTQYISAVVHHVGKVEILPGIAFGIEITDKKYRGCGYSQGTFQNVPYFQCEDNCGMFVALDRLSATPTGPALTRAPPLPPKPGGGKATPDPTIPKGGATPHSAGKTGGRGSSVDSMLTSECFKLGDRVVIFTKNSVPIRGAVRWAGRKTPTGDRPLKYTVLGIETDVSVSAKDFEYAHADMSHLIKAKKNRSLFIPEGLAMSEEQLIKDKQKSAPSLKHQWGTDHDAESVAAMAAGKLEVGKTQLLLDHKEAMKKIEEEKNLAEARKVLPHESIDSEEMQRQQEAFQEFGKQKAEKVKEKSTNWQSGGQGMPPTTDSPFPGPPTSGRPGLPPRHDSSPHLSALDPTQSSGVAGIRKQHSYEPVPGDYLPGSSSLSLLMGNQQQRNTAPSNNLGQHCTQLTEQAFTRSQIPDGSPEAVPDAVFKPTKGSNTSMQSLHIIAQQLAREADEYQRKQEEKEQYIQELEQQLSQCKQTSEEKEMTIMGKEQEIGEINMKLQQKTEEAALLHLRCSEMEQELVDKHQTFKQALTEKESEASKLQLTLTNKQEELAQIRQELVQKIEDSDQLLKELNNKREELVQLQQERREESDRLHQELEEKMEESDRLHQELEEKTEESDRLHQELEEKTEESDQFQQQLQERATQLAQSQQEASQMREQLMQKEDENQQLQARIDTAVAYLRGAPLTSEVGFDALELWEVPKEEVHVSTRILGTGAWGYVAEGRFRGQNVAVKCLHRGILSRYTTAYIRKEMSIMAQVRHPNLVLLIGVVLDARAGPMIITELLSKSLRSAYEDHQLHEDSKLPILHNTASALNYLHLHRRPIVHRDVSSANILLEAMPNNAWKAKLSDFGSANLVRLATTPAEGCPVYAAPETRGDRTPQTPKVDVYSYGVLICEVVTCQFPDPDNFDDMLQEARAQSPDALYRLIVSCRMQNPEERPTMSNILTELDQLLQ